MAIETVNLADLRPIQTRAETDAATIEEYAEAAQRGAKFPPVTVFADAERNTLWLADGIHRMEAAKLLGKKCIRANVQGGTYADALRIALGANATHGLRRTNADKRHTLEMAWKNRETLFGGDPSQNTLAGVCGISRKTVERFLAAQVATLSQPEKVARCVEPISMSQPDAPADGNRAPIPVRRTIGRDGKVYTRTAAPVNTAPQRIEFDEGFGAKSHNSGSTLNSIVDRFGVEVPPQLRCAFSAQAENDLREVLQHISKARVAIEKGHKTKNPLYANIAQRALIELDNAYSEVKFGKPHCVCRICQGNGRGSCTACHETGFQTQAQYDNNPKEFKA